MELQDKILVKGRREAVFEALNDPEILKQAIPGCEELEATSPTTYQAVVTSKVGPMKIKFKGTAKLSNIVAPHSYTITGEATANIGGKLAQLGGPLIERTSKKLTTEFFSNLENLLAADAPASESEHVSAQQVVTPLEQKESSGSSTALIVVGVVAALALMYFFLA